MRKRMISFVLAIVLCLCTSTVAFAADEPSASENTTTSTTATASVDLTAEATEFSVTVPTTLPVNLDRAGNVVTATNAVITNNSYSPIKVDSITLNTKSTYKLAAYSGNFSNFFVDSKMIGFSIGNDSSADSSVYTTEGKVVEETVVLAAANIDGTQVTIDVEKRPTYITVDGAKKVPTSDNETGDGRTTYSYHPDTNTVVFLSSTVSTGSVVKACYDTSVSQTLLASGDAAAPYWVMFGAGGSGNDLALTYSSHISGFSTEQTESAIVSVVFVFDWADNE